MSDLDEAFRAGFAAAWGMGGYGDYDSNESLSLNDWRKEFAARDGVKYLLQCDQQADAAPWVMYGELDVGLPYSPFTGSVGQTGFEPIDLYRHANANFIVECVNYTRSILGNIAAIKE